MFIFSRREGIEAVAVGQLLQIVQPMNSDLQCVFANGVTDARA